MRDITLSIKNIPDEMYEAFFRLMQNTGATATSLSKPGDGTEIRFTLEQSKKNEK